MRRFSLLIVAFLLFTSSGEAVAANTTVRGSIDSDRLVFSDVTVGERLVLFGVSISSERGMPTIRRFSEVLRDDDRDGAIVFQPRGGVPFRSIWTIVDLSTGSTITVTPEGFDLNHRHITARDLKHDTSDLAVGVELGRRDLDLLLVRPGEGAWVVRAREGGKKDGDRARDGRLTIIFSDADPLDDGFGKSPKHLKPGDVVAALDPLRLALSTLTVTK